MGVGLGRINEWLDELVGGGTWLQMHNGDPGVDGTTNVVVAARVPLSFTTAANGYVSSLACDGVVPPTDDAWSYFTLWSANTNGDLLWSGKLTTGVPVKSGKMVPLESGAIVLSIK